MDSITIRPRIAIIDDFSGERIVNLARKEKTGEIIKTFHGEVIQNIMSARFSEYGIKPEIISFDTKASAGIASLEGTHAQLEKIINSKEKYDAINLSSGLIIPYKKLSERLGKEVTPQNLKNKTADIKKLLLSASQNPEVDIESRRQYKEELEIIEDLETLTAKGVDVYVAAGNEPECFNATTMARGVKSVGGFNEYGMPNTKFCTDSQVDVYGQSVYFPEMVKDKTGKIGIDYTGEGDPDFIFSKEDQKETASIDLVTKVTGTSFAVPMVLASKIIDKDGKRLARK